MFPVELRERHHLPLAKPGRRSLYDDLCATVRGSVRFDAQTRGLYASDASNFRLPPIGVVTPVDVEDVIGTVAVCRAHDVPIVSRGGGTGLAGQCLNHGVVLDHSRHLSEIIDLDPSRRLARVLPGCVLDDLRERAARHGLTFGPDPATHDRCTLGGMLGNNACGVHALQAELHGPGPRTEDNVASLDVLTYGGERLVVGPTSDAEYEAIVATDDGRAEIYRRLRALIDRYGDAVRREFPDIPRRVSGYNLPALLPENGFNVAAALVGSEGTCVTILQASLRLIAHLPTRVLLVAGYDDIFTAAEQVALAREHEPVGLEGIDRLLVELIRRKGEHAEYTELLPEGHAWLMVELGGDTFEEARARAEGCRRALERATPATSTALFVDPDQQAHLWEIRESALAATAFGSGGPAWPGWEDAAVPVDRVADYLRDLQAMYDRYGYQAALYGHFGQGCVHTRIDFDLGSREGIDRYRRFTREAAELVVSHGGSLSGEHGDGQQRSELLSVMYSDEILQAFREFKAIWDPGGRMNPGRIVDPIPRDRKLRIDLAEQRPHPETALVYREDGDDFYHAAMRCVGVGKCRRRSGGVMCPSYMVTGEEAHSTRGRAHLLFEMLKGDVVTDGWRSEEVKDALDLCLACKGCKHECPVSVDLAAYKTEFLHHYYRDKRRPRQAYTFGWIHRWAPLAARMPRLANLLSHTPGLARVGKWVAGMAPQRSFPRFAPHTFRSRFEPSRSGPGRRVILWPDTFNDCFFPEVLEAAAEVLADAGCRVVIPPKRLCCGRALYDYGMLETAGELWRTNLETLADEIDAGTPVVGVEPSCVAAFRDELTSMRLDDPRARRLADHTFTLEEYLVHERDYRPAPLRGRVLFHGHCQGSSIMGTDADRELLDRLGVEVEAPATGCCGMAGAFGFEPGDKYRVSIAAAERVLMPAVRGASADTLIVADGFSCREQISQLGERHALHLAQVLVRARDRAATTGELRSLLPPGGTPRSGGEGR